MTASELKDYMDSRILITRDENLNVRPVRIKTRKHMSCLEDKTSYFRSWSWLAEEHLRAVEGIISSFIEHAFECEKQDVSYLIKFLDPRMEPHVLGGTHSYFVMESDLYLKRYRIRENA